MGRTDADGLTYLHLFTLLSRPTWREGGGRKWTDRVRSENGAKVGAAHERFTHCQTQLGSLAERRRRRCLDQYLVKTEIEVRTGWRWRWFHFNDLVTEVRQRFFYPAQ